MHSARKYNSPAMRETASKAAGGNVPESSPSHWLQFHLDSKDTPQIRRPEVFMSGPSKHQPEKDRDGVFLSLLVLNPCRRASSRSRRRRGRCGTPRGQVCKEPTRPAEGDPVLGHSGVALGGPAPLRGHHTLFPKQPVAVPHARTQSKRAGRNGAAIAELEFSKLAQSVP